MMITSWMKGLALLLALNSTHSFAALIAYDMVNSSSQGLISYQNIYQSGFSSSNDAFKRFESGDLIPDVLIDNSQLNPSDDLGIATPSYDSFFGITDTINSDTSDPVTALWQFDIAGFNNLSFAMSIAAIGDFEDSDRLWVNYSIDGGVLTRLFEVYADESADNSYTLASGSVYRYNDPLVATGGNLISPRVLSNSLQTLNADISATGSVFYLSISAITNGGSEAMAISEIKLFGEQSASANRAQVPETPTLLLMLLALGLTWSARKRRFVES